MLKAHSARAGYSITLPLTRAHTMTLIPSSTPPTQTHTFSAPANALPAGKSPGRLDIGLIANRLFGATAGAARHAAPMKRVQFAEHPTVQTVDGSPIAMAARMRVNVAELSASQCLTEFGDSLRASTIKNQLLMCLNLNRDEGLVSEGSEALLRRAYLRADRLPDKAACGPGDYPYDVLEAFLTVVEQKRPALLTAD